MSKQILAAAVAFAALRAAAALIKQIARRLPHLVDDGRGQSAVVELRVW